MNKHIISYAFNLILLAVIIAMNVHNHMQNQAALAPYLRETHHCDYNDPAFGAFSLQPSASKRETALHIFRHVRDSYTLSYDLLDVPASETFQKEGGACWNKALLMTALLRKYEIPARIVKVPLNREFLRPLSGDAVEMLNDPFYHCFVQVNLDNHWIYADPSVDSVSYNRGYASLDLDWNNDWNGRSNQILHKSHIVGAIDIIDNIDETYATTIGNIIWDLE